MVPYLNNVLLILDTCRKSPCYRGVTCTPYDDGTFVCGSCPEGMQGDGIKCIDIDEVIAA